jgi:RimJ/RimL family protein N-acetyltransferase
MPDLSQWTVRARPERIVLAGRYVRLEPLDPVRHSAGLYTASATPEAAQKFRWLFETPPESLAALSHWVEQVCVRDDPLFFAVVDQSTQAVLGRQSLMRIEPNHGVIEIGNIYWGPTLAGTRRATEAQFLFMQYVFEQLQYRRYEWKCHADNAPSRRAALRFGFVFEGIFRQHMVFKGGNRDTAWFAIIDTQWPTLAAAYRRWLAPDNFSADGTQRLSLAQCMQTTRG